MESPHPEWVTTKNGYKYGDNRLTISRLEDGYMVGVIVPNAIAPPSGPLLVTDDEQKAYEIAKVLTWVAAKQGLESLLDDIRGESPGYGGVNWSLGERAPADVDPREAVRRLLGPYAPVLNDILPDT